MFRQWTVGRRRLVDPFVRLKLQEDIRSNLRLRPFVFLAATHSQWPFGLKKKILGGQKFVKTGTGKNRGFLEHCHTA